MSGGVWALQPLTVCGADASEESRHVIVTVSCGSLGGEPIGDLTYVLVVGGIPPESAVRSSDGQARAQTSGGQDMKRITRALLLGALALALAATSAAPAAAGDNEKPRPYESQGNTVLNVDVALCVTVGFETTCPFETSGTQIATHLGLSTSTSQGVVVLDFSPAGACVDAEGRDGAVFSSVNDGTIVAANGDELYTHNEGTGCFVDLGLPFVTTGTQTIDGGTGRFTGASGSMTTVNDGGNFSAVGTITY